MIINNFKVEVSYSKNYEIYTSNNKAIITEGENNIAIIFEVIGDIVCINSVDYGTKCSINANQKVITVEIQEFNEYEEI